MNQKMFEELQRREPELAKLFHYVGPGGHIKDGFYRRIPRTYYDRAARPASQLKVQLAFAEAAKTIQGKHGLKNGMPLEVDAVRKALKGKVFKEPNLTQIIRQLKQSMKELIKVTEI